MRILVIMTVIEMVVFVAVLGYFLARISRLVVSISSTLAKVTFGVRAVETMCAVIGPAVDKINGNLRDVASGLDQAAAMAERAG